MHRVVPELIVENYKAGRLNGEFPAVGMFLDLSGFSSMTDTLMQHGQHGAEVLASLMHGVFDPLVESIFEYGGKIVSFAGDGIMALYPVRADERMSALRSLTSAWIIQKRMLENSERQTIYGKFDFSIKIGLTLGAVSWRILRAQDGGQATYYFRGSAVDDSAKAEHQASAGEIILTENINELLKDSVRTRPLGSFHRFGRFRVEVPDPSADVFPPIDVETSRIFMPEEVIVHDVRGEFRQVVNLFMRFPDLPDEKLEKFAGVIFGLRKKYGGLLTRVDFGDKGCNMLMLWGAPVAHENDIGRALNFVLELQASADFPLTAGVTYYIAHAGYLGSVMCEDYTCYGWGVNLASRFMMGAPDGQVWVDERIARRVSMRFATEYVGSQSFKGFVAEQKVYVLKNRTDESETVYQGEMVGREKELKILKEFAEPLWQGKFAGMLLVTGDAGIGKGRLVHEFRLSEVFELKKALWAVCQSDQILRQSFNPLRRWLLRYFEFSADHLPDQRREIFDAKLNALLQSMEDTDLKQEIERTRSFLGALVDIYWQDSLYAQLDAEGRYNNTFLALIALFKAECLRQPVVLFLEDIQFTDEDTKSFLPRLRRSILAANESYPIAVIVTSRLRETSLTEDTITAQVNLQGLSWKAIKSLTENIVGGTVSPALLKLVAERSEGNPYFIEQIIHYLQEEGGIEISKEGWNITRKPRDTILPGDIRAVLVARLDQVAREIRETIQTASVLGREFDAHVLVQMLQSDEGIMQHIDEAEKAAVWVKLTEMRYLFSHGLLRDAAYTMQMRARRHELHTLAVAAYETLFAEDMRKHFAELAYHADHAGLREKARRYYTLAGQEASHLYQNSLAVDYFTNALAFTPFDDLAAQFDLFVERVEIFSRMGDRSSQLLDLDSLEKLAKQLNDDSRIATVLMHYAGYHYFVGNYPEAIECAKQAEMYSASLGDTELVLYTQVVWSIALFRLGRLDEAMSIAQKTLERDRRAGNRKETSRILSAMGWIALDQNQPTAAREYLSESLEIAREVKDPGLEARALNQLAMLEGSVNGNYALALEYYQVCYQLSREVGDRFMEVGALANMGFAAGMQGDFDSARSYHMQALGLSREIGDVNQQIITLVNLSAVTSIQNDAVTALEQAQRAKGLAVTISERSGEAWAELYSGHAYLMLNDLGNAQTAYRRSIEIRNELGQPTLAMEPIAGMVMSYLQVNDLEKASQEAEKILGFLESGAALDGTDEPLRIYYACYLLLNEKQDPRSSQILQTARNMLDAQVSNLKMKKCVNATSKIFPGGVPYTTRLKLPKLGRSTRRGIAVCHFKRVIDDLARIIIGIAVTIEDHQS